MPVMIKINQKLVYVFIFLGKYIEEQHLIFFADLG